MLALALPLFHQRAQASPPSVVFMLVDTTRADRLGAWGNPADPTPELDRLAASGIRFGAHFANAHATRSSMPQLMGGRYFHSSILRPFRSTDHPREFPFVRPDPTARLLPAILHDAGYWTVGASAHPWVVADSPFGASFDRLDFLPSPIEHGNARAAAVVDRGIELWQARPRDRPTLLYLHFMDVHVPRRLLGDEVDDPVPGYDWHDRFGGNGEPTFGRERRRWRRSDARDFTEQDRRHFRARYDTLLAYLDGQIGRLLAALRADDPELAGALVVVVADHGENLGEEGLIDHGDALTDGVQHVPWIVAGAGIPAGQTTDRFTENVDVAPSVLSVLGVSVPSGIRMDGVAQITPAGTICHDCAKRAVYFAWEDYLGVRTRRRLLRRQLPGSPRAGCGDAEQVFEMRPEGRTPTTGDGVRRLRRLLRYRLTPLDRAFRAARYASPDARFTMRPDFWILRGAPELACAELGVDTSPRDLRRPGWLWTGRGVTVLDGTPAEPLGLAVDVPEGVYRIEATLVPLDPAPRFFGFERWLQGFRAVEPVRYVPVGRGQAHDGKLHVTLPTEAGTQGHLIGIRLSPIGHERTGPEEAAEDPELHERLRVLGYVE